MKLTVHILVHELDQAFGPVAGLVNEDRAFIGARLDAFGAISDDIVYVVDAEDERRIAALAARQAFVLAVGPSASTDSSALALRGPYECKEVHSFLLEVFLRFGQWGQRLDASLIRGEGIQSLLDLSEPMVRNTVVVVDSSLKLLAYTKGIPCDDPVTNELIRHGYHTEENIRKFQLGKRFDIWSKRNGFIVNDSKAISTQTVVAHSFKSGGAFSLVVVMVCSHIDLAPWLLDVLAILIERVAYYSNRDYNDDTPSGISFSVFMRDLLSGTNLPREVVARRASYVGIPKDNAYCLFAFDSSCRASAHTVLFSEIARAVAPAKLMHFGEYAIVLCFNCLKDDTCSVRLCNAHNGGCAYRFGRGCASSIETTACRLGGVLANYGITAGQSSKFYDIVYAPAAFDQALAALSTQSAPGGLAASEALLGPSRGAARMAGDASCGRLEPLEHVVSFDETYMRYIARCVDKENPAMIGSLPGVRLLRDIERDDAANCTDNFSFLRTYLECERRASVVAGALHMHRNSVAYRIKALEEAYCFSVEDPSVRFDLLAAYHLIDRP